MNPDDPKFTAYVLDELSTEERAEVLREIEDDHALATQADELQFFAENLRRQLQGEKMEPLTPEQRATILGEELPAPANIVVPAVAWWRRPWLVSAAAAFVIGGFVSAIYFQARHIDRLMAERSSSHEPVENVALIEPYAHQMEAEDLPEASVSLEIIDRSALALSSDHSPAPKAWSPQPGDIMSRDLVASNVMSTPEVPLVAEPVPIPEPAPAPTTASVPATIRFPEIPAKPRSPESEATARRYAGSSGPKIVAAKETGYSGYETGTVSDTSRGQGGAGTQDRAARLSSSERKVEKELKDLQSRLESLEKRQRHDLEQKTEDPVLKQTVEHVRRMLEALQTSQEGQPSAESYDAVTDNPFLTVKENQLSTFSVDVGAASYANVRRFLEANQRPPKGAVRIEELLNYFRYDYPKPVGKTPFSCITEVATCPWEPKHRLVRVGIKAREIAKNQRTPANLVFLVDVSGSMEPENKLPLVKECLRVLTEQLGPQDSVSIVVYGRTGGCVLEPTNDMVKVRAALDRLEAGGATNGASGIQLAYDLAQRAYKGGASNRVILCTDGDFNVGVRDQGQLAALVQDKAKTGILLSVLGFGFGDLQDTALVKLARNGGGTYGYIDSLAEGRRLFVQQMTGSLEAVATDVRLQVEFNPTKVLEYRLIGYESRLLSKEDFDNDRMIVGQIGAGHAVTALYEIVPVSEDADGAGLIDELKYGPHAMDESVDSPELLTVKVRYKQPESIKSTKLEFPLTDTGANWEQSSRDFRWSAAVAGFGMLLRGSPHRGSLSWALVDEMATEGKAEKMRPEREAFVRLIEKARALSR